ncbi:hypothetical protein [Flavobacterium subsaxonicum]|uniref:Uncharacterized protein n=1 Tax=Flavobacterium subsaxonicum WB 4.1-42 = DSM 21790 TaxID=1121898 RepID=A0A0A2MXV7_9FLAO|nr:hypothetical protein [Flavobacterium subsaxonicum]KGO93055.1 hypothetical protein Q766_10600 [Flavobacterium subsaxonicum WB 4.1-42 = DSM 21790]
MKVCVKIVVLLFFLFLATPTIVSLLQDDDADTIVVCSITEEEVHKEIKEVKAGPSLVFEFGVLPAIKKSTLIKSKNLLRHNNVSGDIFIPPPEVI